MHSNDLMLQLETANRRFSNKTRRRCFNTLEVTPRFLVVLPLNGRNPQHTALAQN